MTMERREPGDSPYRALHEQFVGLRRDAEYFRAIAADETFARILRMRIEIDACWTGKHLSESDDEDVRSILQSHLDDIIDRREQLLASHPDECDGDSLDAPWSRAEERREALLNGMGAHAANNTILRTLAAMRYRMEDAVLIAEVSCQYARSQEGVEWCTEQVVDFLGDTVLSEGDVELPELHDVLEHVQWQLSVVRKAVLKAAGRIVDEA